MMLDRPIGQVVDMVIPLRTDAAVEMLKNGGKVQYSNGPTVDLILSYSTIVHSVELLG